VNNEAGILQGARVKRNQLARTLKALRECRNNHCCFSTSHSVMLELSGLGISWRIGRSIGHCRFGRWPALCQGSVIGSGFWKLSALRVNMGASGRASRLGEGCGEPRLENL
jgi:hypothetical protein